MDAYGIAKISRIEENETFIEAILSELYAPPLKVIFGAEVGFLGGDFIV